MSSSHSSRLLLQGMPSRKKGHTAKRAAQQDVAPRFGSLRELAHYYNELIETYPELYFMDIRISMLPRRGLQYHFGPLGAMPYNTAADACARAEKGDIPEEQEFIEEYFIDCKPWLGWHEPRDWRSKEWGPWKLPPRLLLPLPAPPLALPSLLSTALCRGVRLHLQLDHTNGGVRVRPLLRWFEPPMLPPVMVAAMEAGKTYCLLHLTTVVKVSLTAMHWDEVAGCMCWPSGIQTEDPCFRDVRMQLSLDTRVAPQVFTTRSGQITRKPRIPDEYYEFTSEEEDDDPFSHGPWDSSGDPWLANERMLMNPFLQ